MTGGFFITGTDTGVGKTVVSAMICSILSGNGRNVYPVKPIQSGCVKGANEELIAPDLEFILKSCAIKADSGLKRLLCPIKYRTESSPHLAAKIEGRESTVDEIRAAMEALILSREKDSVFIVEGAGGILVPVNSEYEMMVDIAVMLSFPVIVVARSTLGTLNHTLLTINELRRNGLKIAGVIFNDTRRIENEEEFIVGDNIETIEKIANVKIIGRVRYNCDLPEIAQNPLRFRNFSNENLSNLMNSLKEYL